MRKAHINKKKHHYTDEHKNESLMEISVYLFIPLVIFILIATIASIAGFLYILINFSTSTNNIEEKSITHSHKNLQEILTKIKLKNQSIKKKKKEKNTCNYIQEPESEGKVLNI